MRKDLGIHLKNCEKLAATWGPLTLAVSALPPELWPPGDSQPPQFSVHVCAVRIPLEIDQ